MGEVVRISLSRKQAALVCASLDWVRTQLGFYDDYAATLGKQLGKPHTARMLETFFPEIASLSESILKTAIHEWAKSEDFYEEFMSHIDKLDKLQLDVFKAIGGVALANLVHELRKSDASE